MITKPITDLHQDVPEHDLIEWQCACGNRRHRPGTCRACGHNRQPFIGPHPAAVALTLVDYEDADGRTLLERIRHGRQLTL